VATHLSSHFFFAFYLRTTLFNYLCGMAKKDDTFKNIVAHAKEYGFVFQSSELYDGLSAVYDYGQLGVELKNNIKQYWWDAMVKLHDNIVGLDSAIFMHPTTWKASGHVDAFNDPLIDNKDSKKRYRADVLVEDWAEKIRTKITKEITKAKKRFGESFDETQFRATNSRVLANQEKIDTALARMAKCMDDNDLEAFYQLIIDLEIKCPVSGSGNWTEVRQFNLMFGTQMGALAEGDDTVWLRPETAQGIFVNYLNVQKSGRQKIPFGIAQIGKAFRNEIVARQFIFRQREFEQMEMQFFVRPGEEMKWYEHWKEFRLKWHKLLDLGEDKYRFHDHIKLAHYANAAADIEFDFPFGFKELEGVHSRTDFDLKAHEEHSGRKIKYYDPELKESYTPYVVETSVGLDRMFLAVLSASYKEEEVNGAKRTVLSIPAFLAPYKVAVLPLTKNEDMMAVAETILKDIKYDYNCQYDVKDAIGKRYRRQDAIGTPFCITVDNETLEDQTVTLRFRDSMEQKRVNISELKTILDQELKTANILKKLEA
jgi:glycyl-tRNA synthetase